MLSIRPWAPVLALALISAPVLADSTVYNTSPEFLSLLAPGAYTETFNGLADLAAGPVSFSTNGFRFSLSAPSDLYASGDFIGTSQINEALTINFFSGNVYAVGANFFASNVSDELQPVQISLSLSDGTNVSYTPTSLDDSFRGFVSDVAITSLTINAPGMSLYAGVDNLTLATAVVPEPASALLACLGLIGVAATVRRSRQA
jgi:hypothetical protein